MHKPLILQNTLWDCTTLPSLCSLLHCSALQNMHVHSTHVRPVLTLIFRYVLTENPTGD